MFTNYSYASIDWQPVQVMWCGLRLRSWWCEGHETWWWCTLPTPPSSLLSQLASHLPAFLPSILNLSLSIFCSFDCPPLPSFFIPSCFILSIHYFIRFAPLIFLSIFLIPSFSLSFSCLVLHLSHVPSSLHSSFSLFLLVGILSASHHPSFGHPIFTHISSPNRAGHFHSFVVPSPVALSLLRHPLTCLQPSPILSCTPPFPLPPPTLPSRYVCA